MKEVINLQGEVEEVSADTTVRTANGVHYLLTEAEETELSDRATAWEAEQADYVANEKYKDDRKAAYGSVEDQLDMIYWDGVNETTTFQDHVAAVKVAHPKP